jgi:hypothetical protein
MGDDTKAQTKPQNGGIRIAIDVRSLMIYFSNTKLTVYREVAPSPTASAILVLV